MTLEIVADTNIAFSAIIKPGKIRRLILTRANLKLHIPEELAQELHNHEEKLRKYLDLETTEIHRLIDDFLAEAAKTHEKKEYQHTLQKARKLVEKVDPADAPFIALAMHLKIPLWTGDKKILELSVKTGFKHFITIDTEGVEMLLNGEPLEKVKERMKEKYGGPDINTTNQ